MSFTIFCFQPPPAATPPVSQNEAVTVKQEKTVSYKWRTKAFTCRTEVKFDQSQNERPTYKEASVTVALNCCLLLVGVSIKFICERGGDKQISEECGS